MSILDLTNINRAWLGGQRLSGVWIAGQQVWVAPPPELSDFYGLGPGQIPLRLMLSDASTLTVDGDGYVSAARNQGGAGAYFNASSTGAERPRWTGSYTDFAQTGSVDDEKLLLTTAADMVGTHTLFPVYIGTFTDHLRIAGTNLQYKDPAAHGIHVGSVSSTSKRISFTAGTTALFDTAEFAVAPERWGLVEARIQGGQITLWFNGVMLTQRAFAPATWLIDTIGAARREVGKNWRWPIGEVLSIVCDGAYSAAAPEPAVLIARALYADQFGISLP